jgi:hypothetical protein
MIRPDRPRGKEALTDARLIVAALIVAALIGGSLAVMANQSGKLIGVHEVPPFVCDRVDIVPGSAVDLSAGGVGLNRSDRITPDAVPPTGSRNPICARETGG